MKTAAERQKARSKLLRLAGLIPITVWADPADKEKIMAFDKRKTVRIEK